MRRVVLVIAFALCGCGLFAAPGQKCSKHEECSGLKGGYCSRAEICTTECSETVPCPENSQCSVQGVRTVCLPTCERDTQCASGLSCVGGLCQVTSPLSPFP